MSIGKVTPVLEGRAYKLSFPAQANGIHSALVAPGVGMGLLSLQATVGGQELELLSGRMPVTEARLQDLEVLNRVPSLNSYGIYSTPWTGMLTGETGRAGRGNARKAIDIIELSGGLSKAVIPLDRDRPQPVSIYGLARRAAWEVDTAVEDKCVRLTGKAKIIDERAFCNDDRADFSWFSHLELVLNYILFDDGRFNVFATVKNVGKYPSPVSQGFLAFFQTPSGQAHNEVSLNIPAGQSLKFERGWPIENWPLFLGNIADSAELRGLCEGVPVGGQPFELYFTDLSTEPVSSLLRSVRVKLSYPVAGYTLWADALAGFKNTGGCILVSSNPQNQAIGLGFLESPSLMLNERWRRLPFGQVTVLSPGSAQDGRDVNSFGLHFFLEKYPLGR